MLPDKKEHPKEKEGLHRLNKHRARYNFKELIESCNELAPFVSKNKYDDESIDFSNPKAVLQLNKALLKHYYGIQNWDIPENYLCPPIPGRADYIHNIAQLLGNSTNDIIPKGKNIRCLDIGVGASCIYPIIGVKEYEWSFVGADIDNISLNSAAHIIETNAILKGNVELRLQSNSNDIFRGIIQNNEVFDVTICNPPFHSSLEEAKAGTLRKLSNLNHKKITKPTLNFGGKSNELWCDGGEEKFVKNMIIQSKEIPTSCFLFSSIVSKQAHLNAIYWALKESGATDVKTIEMAHGNKVSRIVAWTFLNQQQQADWIEKRWNLKI
jgi:23S rRNA (adenine1618-N6)-methyltransferase